MKLLISILGCINGLYMLVDGIFVMAKGKYIGPEKPGPWANLFYKLGVDVFKLGPLFILFGLAWLCWIISFWSGQSVSWLFGIMISVLTLWYLPVGTLFSLVILITLIVMRTKSLL
jgi:hypothetical protein